MKSSLKVNDAKWREIKRQLPKIDDAVVKVGVHSDAGETDGTSIAQYAFFNEFGTSNIPERSFLRSAIDENLPKFNRFIENRLSKVLTLQMTPRQAFEQLGLLAAGDIQEKISSGDFTPNAQSTIDQKTRAGKVGDQPLINTGAMRRAIRHEVENV